MKHPKQKEHALLHCIGKEHIILQINQIGQMNCHNQEFTVKELNLTESTAFQHNTFELRLINQSKGNPADEEASSENTIFSALVRFPEMALFYTGE